MISADAVERASRYLPYQKESSPLHRVFYSRNKPYHLSAFSLEFFLKRNVSNKQRASRLQSHSPYNPLTECQKTGSGDRGRLGTLRRIYPAIMSCIAIPITNLRLLFHVRRKQIFELLFYCHAKSGQSRAIFLEIASACLLGKRIR